MSLCPFQCSILEVHDTDICLLLILLAYLEYLVMMGSAGCLCYKVTVFLFVVVKYVGGDTLRKYMFFIKYCLSMLSSLSDSCL